MFIIYQYHFNLVFIIYFLNYYFSNMCIVLSASTSIFSPACVVDSSRCTVNSHDILRNDLQTRCNLFSNDKLMALRALLGDNSIPNDFTPKQLAIANTVPIPAKGSKI